MSLPSFTGDFGIAPGLEQVIGRPYIKDVVRWRGLLNGGTRTGQEFSDSWLRMKIEAEERATFLNDSLDGSILSAEAASAGVGFDDKTSRTSIVKQLERLQYPVSYTHLRAHET